jgi:hypothetical protein
MAANDGGWTALHRACFNGHATVARFLVGDGHGVSALGAPRAVVDARNAKGSRPTHVAIPNGHVHVLRFLGEEVGADLEATNHAGDTPLHFAVMCRRPDAVAYLLSRGCNAAATNRDGHTPLETARLTAQPDAIKMLKAALANPAIEQRDRSRERGRRRSGTVSRGKSRERRAKSKGESKEARGTGATRSWPRGSATVAAARDHDEPPAVGGGTGRHDSGGRPLPTSALAVVALEDEPTRSGAIAIAWRHASVEVATVITLRPSEGRKVLAALGVPVIGRDDRGEEFDEHGDEEEEEEEEEGFAAGRGITLPLDEASVLAEALEHAVATCALGVRVPLLRAPLGARRGELARQQLLSLVRGPETALRSILEAPPLALWGGADVRALIAKLEVC